MLLDLVAIDKQFTALAPEYATADPFPHAVMQNLIAESVLESVLDEFPSAGDMELNRANAHEVKSAESRWSMLGPTTRSLVSELMTSEFLDSLSKLTGIGGLIADTRLRGGGLHSITRGGRLNLHADFNVETKTGLHRRLNLLVYLNRDWDPDWNGQLELWPDDMSSCRRRVIPEFGTAVIFNTTSSSFHGHPDPLLCPPGVERRSLALYYYTVPQSAEKSGPIPHSTLFRARPGTDDMPAPAVPTVGTPSTPISDAASTRQSIRERTLLERASSIARLLPRSFRRLRRELAALRKRVG